VVRWSNKKDFKLLEIHFIFFLKIKREEKGEKNMLFIIGLGLCDEKDITVKGLEAVKSCERLYLEAYTSILMVNKEKLVKYFIFINRHNNNNICIYHI